ncbi:TraY domain-containing protein [Klebsiella pneumoniae]|uniref:TraY domain-containing protein n=1 Tax=Klebsiella pneumoniae TaxID=573 RepID=UPI0018750680|nr:TraY domain-containing protein [Klebsiella pneumoniae]MBE5241141.1 TraY domain-containing protein [Klebsiella pneumoniae]MBE5291764.1 TraY domain-containing protein [Klebsiella pneumoniae]MBJ8213946.1 TraY domain-containing protein [Klebsiella pneumoniae]
MRDLILQLSKSSIYSTKPSRRSKTAEAYLRLKDHLERFPDFYNSELAVPGGEKE